MAQYYHPRRATSSSITSETQQAITLHDASHRYPKFQNAVSSSSILVFPNPPSERESLRDENSFEATGSTPSLPTDVSFGSSQSTRSRSRSQGDRNENERSWHRVSRPFPQKWDEHISEEEWEWELDGDDLRNRWDGAGHVRRRGRVHGERTLSNASSFSGSTSSLAPQPPFHLPFLSCLQTFLNLDESTLHLLSRSPNPHASVLFPFSPGSPSPSYDDYEAEPMHGTHKLLLDNPDKPRNSALLKVAMDPHDIPIDANPFLASPVQLPVWQFLKFVMKGGVRAWKEVRVWHAWDEPRLVGV